MALKLYAQNSRAVEDGNEVKQIKRGDLVATIDSPYSLQLLVALITGQALAETKPEPEAVVNPVAPPPVPADVVKK